MKALRPWKALFRFFACISTVNRSAERDLLGVPPSGGPDRPKPGHRTVGSWKAPFRLLNSEGKFAFIRVHSRLNDMRRFGLRAFQGVRIPAL
jgi:hypothetical protein